MCIMLWFDIHIHCEMTTRKLFSVIISFHLSLTVFSISLTLEVHISIFFQTYFQFRKCKNL